MPDETSQEFARVCHLDDRDEGPGPADETLVLVSAFDGIGGARRALELLGVRPAVYISALKMTPTVSKSSRILSQR